MQIKLLKKKYDHLLQRFHLEPFREFFVFAFITIILHLIWKAWGYFWESHLFGYDVLGNISEVLLEHIRYSSAWIMTHLFGVNTVVEGDTLICSAIETTRVTFGCSGLKQFYQLAGLMIFYPGPWRHKIWYIPAGIILMHLINLVRVISLSFVVLHNINWFDFSHDWILRPLFYVVMFGVWVVWEEKFRKTSKNENNTIGNPDHDGDHIVQEN